MDDLPDLCRAAGYPFPSQAKMLWSSLQIGLQR